MGLIDDNVKNAVKNDLVALTNNVKLIVFSSEADCHTCKDNVSLIEDLVSLSGKLSVEKYDLQKDSVKAQQYRIDKVPAIAIIGNRDFGIRFYGIPGGYEFMSLIDAIKLVSSEESQLNQQTKDAISQMTKPVQIKIFVTPTCPYCPAAVKLGNRFAVQNDSVFCETIISNEFPQLSAKYSVFSVPKVIINESVEFVGALPEDGFLTNILKA